MKSAPKSAIKILEEIKNHQSFCVVGHIRPDGDCIGSQLALTLALKSLGADVVCWNQDPLPPKLLFMDPQGWLVSLLFPLWGFPRSGTSKTRFRGIYSLLDFLGNPRDPKVPFGTPEDSAGP